MSVSFAVPPAFSVLCSFPPRRAHSLKRAQSPAPPPFFSFFLSSSPTFTSTIRHVLHGAFGSSFLTSCGRTECVDIRRSSCPLYLGIYLNQVRQQFSAARYIRANRLQALFWNLLSGIPAIVGAVLILALGDLFTNFQIAIIFLLGAGSFILIGLTELLPEALSSTKSGLGESAKKLASFAFGGLIIGIPLMFHAHCHPGEGHEGHDH